MHYLNFLVWVCHKWRIRQCARGILRQSDTPSFLAPFITHGIGMKMPRYINHRGDRLLVYTLFAFLAYSALTTWLNLTIDQQLVR